MRYIDCTPVRAFHITNFPRNCNRIYSVCLSIGISLFLFIILSIKYGFFLGLDDIGIRDILSGLYTGEPCPYTFFMLYPLAKLLSLLYTWLPDIYWYLFFLIVANYGCLALVIYRVTCSLKKHKFVSAFIIVMCFLIMWMWRLIDLEWTATSAMLSATAIFWYATICLNENNRHEVIDYMIPIVLLTLAFNLRNLVAEMAIPFIGIIFLIRLFKKKNKLFFLKREILFFLILGIIIMACYIVNLNAYSSDEWRDEVRYNGYRSMISDRYGYLDYNEWKLLFEKNGITKEMWDIISYDGNYMLATSGVIRSENMGEIANTTKTLFYNGKSKKDLLIESIKERMISINSDTYALYSIIFYVEMLISILSGILKKDKIQVFLTIALTIGFEIIWIWLYYGNRLPERVGISLYIIGISTGIGLLWQEHYFFKVFQSRGFCLMMVLVVLLITGKNIIYVNQKYAEYNYEDVLVLKQYCEEHRENIYLKDYISLLGVELQNGDEMTAANFVPSVPWESVKPIKNQYIPAGSDQELCNWISQQKNIYLIAKENRAEGLCDRQEALFASRGYKWKWVFEEEISSPKNIFYVYHGTCN